MLKPACMLSANAIHTVDDSLQIYLTSASRCQESTADPTFNTDTRCLPHLGSAAFGVLTFTLFHPLARAVRKTYISVARGLFYTSSPVERKGDLRVFCAPPCSAMLWTFRVDDLQYAHTFPSRISNTVLTTASYGIRC